MNIEHLGQVFTEDDNIVERMLALRHNQGSVLEPSAGKGAFFNKIPGAVGIEIDPLYRVMGCQLLDFFDYPITFKFNTIIGNPPYVAYKNIYLATKEKLKYWFDLFDERTNLYLFFMWKCLQHLEPGGEIIFITPRDFLKTTSAEKLNKTMWDSGTLTHFYETGDKVVFPGVAPNCAIWRYEMGNMTHVTKTNEGLKNQVLMGGQIAFTQAEFVVPFSEIFSVHVGAVSGADKIYTHPNGNYEFICSSTKKTGKTKRMFYGVINDSLLGYKDKLLARKVIKFTEENWWEWGRKICDHVDLPRVYVNCKTRLENPFFTHPCRQWDGAVLAIFCHPLAEEEAAFLLNQVDWAELGFKVGGRFCFSQRALQNCMLPTNLFGKYLERIKNETK